VTPASDIRVRNVHTRRGFIAPGVLTIDGIKPFRTDEAITGDVYYWEGLPRGWHADSVWPCHLALIPDGDTTHAFAGPATHLCGWGVWVTKDGGPPVLAWFNAELPGFDATYHIDVSGMVTDIRRMLDLRVA
jgi:hypothetical protein